ncbi:MAG: hypothetical protein CM1200mP29_08140 [Verrucomicrobiota bacterium]|nr:MAG: hypothetical protein CM1200mP29_08140 [Verrucomicrobiota bacterium]
MDVKVTDEEGLTALYRAAHNDQKETVSLLLSNGGPKVNIRDKFGNTPWMSHLMTTSPASSANTAAKRVKN